MSHTISPPPLQAGDKIVICSPAGCIDSTLVRDAAAVLSAQGYAVEIAPHALGRSGTYSGTLDERLADLKAALTDMEVRAIVCSRGGYGMVHLLDELSSIDLAVDPKWVVGFSDISALHALMHSQGVQSIHGPMARYISLGANHPPIMALLSILRGKRPSYTFPSTPLDRHGEATGELLGGNLAVLAGLAGSPYDILRPDTILFIEDISEPIYRVERMLYQLRYSGVLSRLHGLIVGRFTDYRPDANHSSMEAMIARMVEPYDYPVAYGAPIGHFEGNMPVIEGATVTLRVGENGRNFLLYN